MHFLSVLFFLFSAVDILICAILIISRNATGRDGCEMHTQQLHQYRNVCLCMKQKDYSLHIVTFMAARTSSFSLQFFSISICTLCSSTTFFFSVFCSCVSVRMNELAVHVCGRKKESYCLLIHLLDLYALFSALSLSPFAATLTSFCIFRCKYILQWELRIA